MTKDKIGISRESYGRGETLGIKYIIDLAEEFGFYIEKDDAANIVMINSGADVPKATIVSPMSKGDRSVSYTHLTLPTKA